MKKLFRKIHLFFRPIQKDDFFWGYTNDLVKDKAVSHLRRIISIRVLSSQDSFMVVEYRYNGKAGALVSGVKNISKKHLNSHYESGRMHFV